MKKVRQTSQTDVATSTLWNRSTEESLFNCSLQQERRSIKDNIGSSGEDRDGNPCSEVDRTANNSSSLASLDSRTPTTHQRSPYHNFQKHAVVLIQKLAKNMCTQLRSSPGEMLAKQMWSIFENSGIKSKKIIIILFGEAELGKEKYKSLLIRSYFGELCQERQELIREAQSILRRLALTHLQDTKVMAYIKKNRHIKCKHEFSVYFSELLSQLHEGPLQRFRLSSQSSRKILDNFQTASSLNEPTASRVAGNRK